MSARNSWPEEAATTQRKEAISKLTRSQLEAHLALQGWHPVAATTAALQRGNERVYVIGMARGLTTGVYTHSKELPRHEEPWGWVKFAHLIMMAHKIEEEGL